MPNKKPITFSLVIPAYNEEKYLGACLDHAVKNSEGLLDEIIVIDNASTDGTAKVAAKYKKYGVRVVREDRKGLTRARERGFLEAKGEIVAYTDADTLMPEGWCRRAIGAFYVDPKVVCLSGPYLYYDSSRWQQFLTKYYSNFLMSFVGFVFGYVINGGNFVIRRDTLEKMNGFDTTIEFFGEDTDVARRAHEFGKVKFDLDFIMPTSGRRFTTDGTLMTGIRYVTNYLSIALFHRPAGNSKKYNDIR